jgi:hypothetical protein
MRGHVDGHAVDVGGEVGAVVKVDTPQKLLIRFAVTRELRDHHAGYVFQHISRAQETLQAKVHSTRAMPFRAKGVA